MRNAFLRFMLEEATDKQVVVIMVLMVITLGALGAVFFNVVSWDL